MRLFWLLDKVTMKSIHNWN